MAKTKNIEKLTELKDINDATWQTFSGTKIQVRRGQLYIDEELTGNGTGQDTFLKTTNDLEADHLNKVYGNPINPTDRQHFIEDLREGHTTTLEPRKNEQYLAIIFSQETTKTINKAGEIYRLK